MRSGRTPAAIPACPPLRFAPRPPFTDMGWEILPEGIELALRKATDHLPGVPIWICENGAAVDEVTDDTGIHDPIRTTYIGDHLRALTRVRSTAASTSAGTTRGACSTTSSGHPGWTKKFGHHPRRPGDRHADAEGQRALVPRRPGVARATGIAGGGPA